MDVLAHQQFRLQMELERMVGLAIPMTSCSLILLASRSNLSFAPVENVNAQFVRDLLERCVHLSYFERVSKVLPSEPSMLPLMPVQPEPCFDYQTVFENGEKNAELEEALIALVDRLTDGMRLRYSVPDMKQILHDIAAYGVTKGYFLKLTLCRGLY